MKKLLIIAILMLALVFTVVACTETPAGTDTTDADTTVETPTEAPTDEPETPTDAPEETTDAPEETTEEPATEAPETPTEPTETDPPATEAPTEAPTADPADPVWIADPDAIAGVQGAGTTAYIAGVEVMEENDYKFARITVNGGDSQFVIGSNLGTMPKYLAISYRVNADKDGEMFIGTADGPNGKNDHYALNWNKDNTWNLIIVDVSTIANVTDGNIGYFRFDPFRDVTEGYIDIEYLAFFNTAEYALAYDFELHPPYVEADDASAGKVGNSFDTFYVNGNMYFPQDGGAGDKLTAQDNTIRFAPGEAHDSMVLRGWIGFGQPMTQFGYFIDNYEFVFGDFKTATEDGVLAAGGANASRFEILVPMTELGAGEHFVGFVVMLEDGTIVRLRENIKVIIESLPTFNDTAMNVTVNAADVFNADSAADATEDMKNTALATLFPTITYGAGVPQYAVNGEVPQFTVSSFTEAFVRMDGTYAYSIQNVSSKTKRQASYFIRGAQSVKPEDTSGIANVLNNYYETDGQSTGHAGAGIQFWTHSKLLIAVKYYDESAATKIGTAYWLIAANTKNANVQIIDAGSKIYVTVDGELVAHIELVGSGKTYEGLSVTDNATFCEKAIVHFHVETSDAYGNVPAADGTYVIENTLVVDTPASDVGLATRTGTLNFTSIGISPLSSVDIPRTEPITDPTNPDMFEENLVGASDTTDFAFNNGTAFNLWFWANSFDQNFHILFAKATKDTNRHYEFYTEAGGLNLYAPAVNGGNPVSLGVNMKEYVGRWHMLTLVHDNDQLLVYMDGQLLSTVNAAFTLETGEDVFYVGQIVEGGMEFDGAISELDMMTTVPTADELDLLYKLWTGAFEEPTFPGAIGNLSICSDNVRTWVGDQFTDLCTQEAHLYMNSVDGLINADGMDYISFRGWVNPTAPNIEIAEFGYQIGNGEAVFSADFYKEEPELNAALGSPAAKRFENIKIPVADLDVGVHQIYLLVKDTNGVIYCMNPNWHGNLRIEKTVA